MSETIKINNVRTPKEFGTWLKDNWEAVLGGVVVAAVLCAAVASPHQHSIKSDVAVSVPCEDGSSPSVASDKGGQITLDCRGDVTFLDQEYPIEPIKINGASTEDTPTLEIVTAEGYKNPVVELEDKNRIMKISGVENYVLVA